MMRAQRFAWLAQVGLRCSGASVHSVVLRWSPVVGADRYDVQCATNATAKPLLSYSAMEPIATIEQLTGDTKFLCRVRSHLESAPSIVSGWSPLSAEFVACSTTNGTSAGVQSSAPSFGRDTSSAAAPPAIIIRTLPVYRISEFDFDAEVDFWAPEFGGRIVFRPRKRLSSYFILAEMRCVHITADTVPFP